MIEVDPGTGFVRDLKLRMKAKFGDDFDIFSSCRGGLLTDSQREHMKACFDDWYMSAEDFLQKARDKYSEPVSSSLLFAYFLNNNDGDMLASSWDTATFLKILARNDPDNDLRFDPNFERAN